MILVDHNAGLGAMRFRLELRAQAVKIKGALLEVGVGLELVPGNLVSQRAYVKPPGEESYQMLLQLIYLPSSVFGALGGEFEILVVLGRP